MRNLAILAALALITSAPSLADDSCLRLLTRERIELRKKELSKPTEKRIEEEDPQVDPSGFFGPYFLGYVDTNRTLKQIQEEYPPGTIEPADLVGKKVLDLGCGKVGRFVMQLRDHQIEAYGLDLKLWNKGKEAPYLFEGDLRAMPFEDEQFDRIFATYTVFSDMYEGRNPIFMRESLEEVLRVLKPGGIIDIVGGTAIQPILTVLEENPHLRRLRMTRSLKYIREQSEQRFLELRKE